jgi:hypothetical protein
MNNGLSKKADRVRKRNLISRTRTGRVRRTVTQRWRRNRQPRLDANSFRASAGGSHGIAAGRLGFCRHLPRLAATYWRITSLAALDCSVA